MKKSTFFRLATLLAFALAIAADTIFPGADRTKRPVRLLKLDN